MADNIYATKHLLSFVSRMLRVPALDSTVLEASREKGGTSFEGPGPSDGFLANGRQCTNKPDTQNMLRSLSKTSKMPAIDPTETKLAERSLAQV